MKFFESSKRNKKYNSPKWTPKTTPKSVFPPYFSILNIPQCHRLASDFPFDSIQFVSKKIKALRQKVSVFLFKLKQNKHQGMSQFSKKYGLPRQGDDPLGLQKGLPKKKGYVPHQSSQPRLNFGSRYNFLTKILRFTLFSSVFENWLQLDRISPLYSPARPHISKRIEWEWKFELK